MTFVAVPLGASYPAGHVLMDVSHLLFAAVCAVALTTSWTMRMALLAGLCMLGVTPSILDFFGAQHGSAKGHELISLVTFAFTMTVTIVVALHTFGPGNVTGHRVQGAVLVYLNVAVLFAIVFDMLETHVSGAIKPTAGGLIPATVGLRRAELSYFSLATITTTGYGDLAPVHQLARSLANMEAVFGQLFPATFVARLVALHLAHSERKKG